MFVLEVQVCGLGVCGQGLWRASGLKVKEYLGLQLTELELAIRLAGVRLGADDLGFAGGGLAVWASGIKTTSGFQDGVHGSRLGNWAILMVNLEITQAHYDMHSHVCLGSTETSVTSNHSVNSIDQLPLNNL